MATHKQPPTCSVSHDRNSVADTVSIPNRAARRRWSIRPSETEWQVEPQYGESRRGERNGHLNQEFGLAVCTSAVREHNRVPRRLRRHVQETMNGGLSLKINNRDRHRIVSLWASEKSVHAPGGPAASKLTTNKASSAR